MAAARPLVGVQALADGSELDASIKMPAVLLAPIRPDIVQFVHTQMNFNKRQAYSVSKYAGHQHSAHSWGTGRAVSRIPRVSGGGTSRAGQAAFGNMCRKGRMFGPTKTWRKWHRKINTNQKRYAVASALAASCLPSLVMARGHRVSEVAEMPLVVDNSAESFKKTKDAIAALKYVGAYADVEKSAASRKIRAGKGKMRGRRHVQRRGPLVVYSEDNGIVQAFRNLPGVDLCNVERLNLLQLAPGGHLGRLIVWTASAFSKLNSIYGTLKAESSQKKGYTLPRNIITNSDVTRLINSQEVQSVVRAARTSNTRAKLKKNPLKNLGAMVKLNPYALTLRRKELLYQEARKAGKVKKASRSKNYKGSNSTKHYARISAADLPHEEVEVEEPKEEEEAPAETTQEAEPAAPAAPASAGY